MFLSSTTRTLQTRISEHKGLRHQLVAPLVRPPEASIRDYALTCSSDILVDDFKIFAYQRSELSLRNSKSCFIFHLKNDA